MKDYIIDDWLRTLKEADMPGAAQPEVGGGPPTTDPNAGGLGQVGNPMPGDPNAASPPAPDMGQGGPAPVDVNQDPSTPDMPEDDESGGKDFEVWRKNYLKESVKGDANILKSLLSQIRDKELDPYQRKFVEDNWNIQLIRENSNVLKCSKEVRSMLKDQLDRNNPSASLVNHVTASLETNPMLNSIFLKLNGYGALKGDLHRKFVAALMGGVQVGGGANLEDLVYNEKDFAILISTRFNAQWGDVMIGDWSLKEDDPKKYLSGPELKKLTSGSPEEKDVLRRRVVVESIAKQFETRAFIISVIEEDGTIYWFGWDIANSLRNAYADGKLVVRTRASDNSEAMINGKGEIVPLLGLSLYYVKKTGRQDEDGMPEKEELEFLQRKHGTLFLSATLQTIKEAAMSMAGSVFKEIPYNGNPSDMKVLKRCVYSAHDLIMRQC